MPDAQVRINDLARELEVKAKAIIELLPDYGVTEKKTHSSSIPADVAEKIRRRIPQRVYISYAHGDETWRTRIANHLRERGLAVWGPLDAESDPNQALLRRERSSVFILLLSIRYVDSEHIRRIEYPHIRSLVASRKAQIIDVVLESCPWQSFFSLPLPTSLTIPEGERTLASGDDEQIEDDLHTLARAVRKAFSETFSTESQQSHQASPELQASPDRPPLAQLLAARLLISSQSGEYRAMATFISPTLALTSSRAISESGLLKDPNPAITVESLAISGYSTQAILGEIDESLDYALLQLNLPLPFQLPSPFIRTTLFLLNSKWQSCFVPLQGPAVLYDGIVKGSANLGGKSYTELAVNSPSPKPGTSGAPVTVDDRLVGIVGNSDDSGNFLYVTPIKKIVESSKTDAVRNLWPDIARRISSPSPTSGWITQETFDRFSPATQSTLARADQLRNEYTRRRIHVSHLLLALSEEPESQLRDLLINSGIELQSALASELHSEEISGPNDHADGLVGFPPVSPNVRLALASARDKANADHCESILASHILFGTLSTIQNQTVRDLNSKGITPDRIRLPVRPSALAESESPLAGYHSDEARGADLLDITKEVEGLASVLAAHDVSPPLSLGLFGDWGTGKTFFMNQLEARIRQLQEDAKLAGGDSAYCRNIVQIKFNAWNYIDCNLWASLTSEIFERLAGHIAKERGEDSPEQRALVLAAASSAQTILAEAERKKAEAEEELRKTEERIVMLTKSAAGIEAELDPAEVLRQAFQFALADDGVQRYVDEAARALRIPETKAAVREVRSELLDLQGTGSGVILALKNERYLWVWLSVLGVALALVWLIPRILFHSDIELAAVRLLASLTAISVALAPLVKASRKAMSLIEKARASKQALVDQKRKEQTDRLGAVRDHVRQRVDEAHMAYEIANAKVKALNDQLEKMRADRRLVDYIRQRHQSTDYTQHLGIISRVRADFHHLSTLLREAKEESDADAKMKERQKEKDHEREREKKPPLFPPIDRIVLYVDDLDRCPEKNVVEVLQAVHLLLAFPLFVVVVGVDPRWLLHSLQRYSKAFHSDEEPDGAGKSQGDELHWCSTPLNYLEKIFQIPFSLRPIDKRGFGRIVDALAIRGGKEQRQPASVTRPVNQELDTQPAVSAIAPEALDTPVERKKMALPSQPSLPEQLHPAPPPQQPALPPLKVESPPHGIDRHPEHLQFRDWEREFIKQLHEFVPTPRAAKRFINIYRLLRASVREDERAGFVGDQGSGEYQAAMILLAILTGYPAQATEILGILVERQPRGTWWDFISALKTGVMPRHSSLKPSSFQSSEQPNRPPASEFAAAPGKTPDAPTTETQSWVELFDKLDRLRDSMQGRSCPHFVDWAPRVARYSFQSGRVLSNRPKQTT